MNTLRIIKSYSMSNTKQDAEQTIKNLKKTVADHILLCLVFGKTSNTKHWVHEISERLEVIYGDSFIKNNKRLKEERIYELLHPGTLDDQDAIDSYIRNTKLSKASLKPIEISPEIVPKNFRKLYLELSRMCNGKTFSRMDCEFFFRKYLKDLFNVELE